MFKPISVTLLCKPSNSVLLTSIYHLGWGEQTSLSDMILRRCLSRLSNKYLRPTNNMSQSLSLFNIHNRHCAQQKSNIKIHFNDFHLVEVKDKQAFVKAIRQYEKTFTNKKGHLEFISSAMKRMEEFGVHEDLEAYKELMNIFPKSVLIPKNYLQFAMQHFPKHQDLALDLLEQMERNGVHPDVELGKIIFDVFGRRSRPFTKFDNLLYWTTKFKNKCPWYLPRQLTSDPILLAQMAVKQITSVDFQTEITVFKTEEISEAIDKTWIVSGQSPDQRELLSNHSHKHPVVVEGGDLIYLRKRKLHYFLLKADYEENPPEPKNNDRDDLLNMQTMYFDPNYVEEREPTVHEQDNGIIYAVCITGTSSKDSLLSWIRLLEKNGNPVLEKLPVLFRLKSLDLTPVPTPAVIGTQQEQPAA